METLAFGAGAFHRVAEGWRPVTHRATLRMLERAEYIVIPPEYGQRGRSSIGPVIHRYVLEGENAPRWGEMFTVRGRRFRIQYADGCFHPFVWEFKTQQGTVQP